MIHQPSIINHPIIPSSNHLSMIQPIHHLRHLLHNQPILSTTVAPRRRSLLAPRPPKNPSPGCQFHMKGGQVGEFQGEPKMGKNKNDTNFIAAGVDSPSIFWHIKMAGFGMVLLEEGMSTMVPTNNSGMPKKKNWIDNSWLLLCNPGGYHPKLEIKTRHYV